MERVDSNAPRTGSTWAAGALAALTGINLFNYLDRQVLPAVLVPLKAEMGWSDGQLGTAAAAFMLGYFLTAPVFGYLGDRLPRKWLIVLGVAVWSLGTVLSGRAHGYGEMILFRILVGLGEASYGTISPGWIADLYPAPRRNTALSVFYMAIPGRLGPRLSARRRGRGALGLAGGLSLGRGAGVLARPGLVRCLREPARGACDADGRRSQGRARAGPDGGTVHLPAAWPPVPAYVLTVAGYVAQTFAHGRVRLLGPDLPAAGPWHGARPGQPVFRALPGRDRADRHAPGRLPCHRLAAAASGGLRPLAGSERRGQRAGGLRRLSAARPGPGPAALVAAMFLIFLGTGPVNTLILESVPVAMRASAMAGLDLRHPFSGRFLVAKDRGPALRPLRRPAESDPLDAAGRAGGLRVLLGSGWRWRQARPAPSP